MEKVLRFRVCIEWKLFLPPYFWEKAENRKKIISMEENKKIYYISSE